MKSYWVVLSVACCIVVLLPDNTASWAEDFIDWEGLENPVYSHPGWSTKDPCMAWRDGTFYLFFSALYEDRGRVRSHVVGVKSTDFQNWSEPLIIWDGRDDGWIGMCSPNISKIGGAWYLTYNSWGDMDGRPNQLFYRRSTDLENWEERQPLAPEVTVDHKGRPRRGIDGALAKVDNTVYLIWKEGRPHMPRAAKAPAVDGPYEYIGHGYVSLMVPGGGGNGLVHENFELLFADGHWRLISTDYNPQTLYIYTLTGQPDRPESWLTWGNGRKVLVPMEPFNTHDRFNAGFIADWREYDGHYYLISAGCTERESYAGRGNNKLGLTRSTDLIHWKIPDESYTSDKHY